MKNILIAFSGMDGSGKTTLADKIQKYLQRKGREVYFRHAHGYAFSQNSLAVSENTLRHKKIFFLLLSPYVLLDSWFIYLKNYRKILKRQTLLSDRYFYDKIVRLIYYDICPLNLAKIYLLLLPKPDIAIFLDIDENSAFLRKPEYSKKNFRRFRSIYLTVAKYLKAPVIETNNGIKDSLESIVKKLPI